MSHYELARRFAIGATKGRGWNMFIENDSIYSYGYHFPVAKKTDKTFAGKPIYFFNSKGYSITTAKHKNYVYGALTQAGAFLIEVPLPEKDQEQYLKSEIERLREKTRKARKDYTREFYGLQAKSKEEQLAVFRFKFTQ